MAQNDPGNVGVDARALIDASAEAATRAMEAALPALVARMHPPPPPPAAAAPVHNMKPEKFPSREYKTWHEWTRHFRWIAAANHWTDRQSRDAVPTCLVGWASDEFAAVPEHLQRHVVGHIAPTLDMLFGYLNPRMDPYRNARMARQEFKVLTQTADEGTRDFARRIKVLCDVAYGNLDAAAQDDAMREQFIDGVQDPEIQDQLMREDPVDFAAAVQRALNLEIVQKSKRLRNKKQITGNVRFTQGETGASSYLDPDAEDQDETPPVADGSTASIKLMLEQQTLILNELREARKEQAMHHAEVIEALKELTMTLKSGGFSYRNRSMNQGEGIECYHCHEKGHISPYCPKKQPLN